MRSLLFAACALFCTGCATLVTGGGETQAVRFASAPRGAKVYVDDNYVGVTPTASELTRKDDHVVRMELAGEVKTEELKAGLNPWIFGNILFGGAIGFIVDAASGALRWPGTSEVKEQFTPPSWYHEPDAPQKP